jgi:hypothetical protein
MNRRRFLGTLGVTLAVAGCSDEATDQSGTTDSDSASTATAVRSDTRVDSLTDPDLPLSDSDLDRGAPKDAIPAITDPAFGKDWNGVDATLAEDDRVIGVAVEDGARAYPLAVLNWHEVVNDTFDGPLLVTYCPLCGSGVTAERRVDGEETIFGVSGLLWNSDLVMYDRLTDSLWSQVLGKAVQGPQTGQALSLLPSSFTTWGEWRAEYPDTDVLLPPPESDAMGNPPRNYDRNPYVGYDDIDRVGIGYNDDVDERLNPKATVIGVATDDGARAYPRETVETRGVVNDTVGGLPVVVTVTTSGSLVAYERTVEGETLTFERSGDTLTAGGSQWAVVTGRARDGSYEGTQLVTANDRSPMFWFAWADFYPGTDIFGRD